MLTRSVSGLPLDRGVRVYAVASISPLVEDHGNRVLFGSNLLYQHARGQHARGQRAFCPPHHGRKNVHGGYGGGRHAGVLLSVCVTLLVRMNPRLEL